LERREQRRAWRVQNCESLEERAKESLEELAKRSLEKRTKASIYLKFQLSRAKEVSPNSNSLISLG
jgi:hypothetical protein